MRVEKGRRMTPVPIIGLGHVADLPRSSGHLRSRWPVHLPSSSNYRRLIGTPLVSSKGANDTPQLYVDSCTLQTRCTHPSAGHFTRWQVFSVNTSYIQLRRPLRFLPRHAILPGKCEGPRVHTTVRCGTNTYGPRPGEIPAVRRWFKENSGSVRISSDRIFLTLYYEQDWGTMRIINVRLP